jgi:hypothetical protein
MEGKEGRKEGEEGRKEGRKVKKEGRKEPVPSGSSSHFRYTKAAGEDPAMAVS